MAVGREVSAVAGFVALASLTITSCNAGSRPGTAHLEGTVTIDGQPLPADAQASITFRPMSGGRSAGATVSGGKYVCHDAPLGKVKVYVAVERPTGKMLVESDNRPYPEVASIIASKYSLGIDVDVTGDNRKLDFELEPATD
jgi:hypothetical protein